MAGMTGMFLSFSMDSVWAIKVARIDLAYSGGDWLAQNSDRNRNIARRLPNSFEKMRLTSCDESLCLLTPPNSPENKLPSSPRPFSDVVNIQRRETCVYGRLLCSRRSSYCC